jgi:ABC-type branched-subunit amino acid transport system substrate-binding protein
MTNDLAGVGETPYGVVSVAIEAYFAKVNHEDDGVCRRDLVLVAKDDQYNPEQALLKTKELVEQDGVLAVIGGLGTAAQIAVANYLNDPNADGDKSDGVPDLFVSTGYSGWGDVALWPWTTGFIPDYQSDATVLARYINENLAGKKVGVLHQIDEFGLDYNAALNVALASPDLLVSAQPYDPAAPDVGPYITNFIEAEAEVIVLATTPEASAPAIAAAHAQGYLPQFLLSYVNSQTQLATLIGGGTAPDQLALGFRELTGAVSTNYLLSAIEDEDDPALVEHTRIMATFAGPPVSTLTIYAQSLAEGVVEALGRTCDKPNRAGLLEAAQSLRGFHPTMFWPGIEVNLGPDDHRAVQAMQVVTFAEDGTLTEVGTPVSVE